MCHRQLDNPPRTSSVLGGFFRFPDRILVLSRLIKQNNPLTSAVSGLHQVERKGVEPSTSALRTQRSPN